MSRFVIVKVIGVAIAMGKHAITSHKDYSSGLLK